MSSRSHDRQGIAVLVGSSLLLVVGFALAFIAEEASPRLDPATLEAAGRESGGCVSILLDLTDPLTPAQRQRLEDRLRKLERRELQPNDLISIWELGSTEEGSLRLAYARYFPGRDANRLWGNPDRVAARCDSLFWAPMLGVLRSLPTRPRADRSPILSTVRELSEQADFAAPRSRRALILVSDLVENSTSACFYRIRPDFQTFRISPAFRTVRADLRDVRVDVLYIARPGAAATAGFGLREFWRAYFSACGASAVAVRRL